MCGITGLLYDRGKQAAHEAAAIVARMTGCVHHRGPDDEGVWLDPDAGVAFGHRRLSVIDLSPEGHQPMLSASGRFAITYNGEIYNYEAIRRELESAGAAPAWRGHSDTEVMLAAVEQWGVHGALERFNGMFAFALWDRSQQVVYLARDRIGEKPLYYGWLGDSFVFASELKALRRHPAWTGEIDPRAVALFMQRAYVPAPYSIHAGIRKLRPGVVLVLPWRGGRAAASPAETAYWSARAIAEAGSRSPFRGTVGDAEQELDRLLRDAVALRMAADVPLGAFLSGGVDSSVVVALMQAQSARPVRSFAIGFTEESYDEARHARTVAAHLGTDHTELYVTPAEATDVIPRLPTMYDEPFADSSQIPTYLVSALARRHVTVSLSGDGGDEVFGGYNRYVWGRAIWRRTNWMPRPLRGAIARSLSLLSAESLDAIASSLDPVIPARLRVRRPGEKLHKLAAVLGAVDAAGMYEGLTTHWDPSTRLVRGAGALAAARAEDPAPAQLPDLVSTMMYMDLVGALPDDMLVKVDRASMAVSLEARVPLLDHRVVEFAWTLPVSMKIRDGEGKWLLRKVLDRYVPRAYVDRPKTGFEVPIGAWLRGPLRDWAESLLDERRIREAGLLDATQVRQRWRDHLSGDGDWRHHLWDVLMFQSWLSEQTAGVKPSATAPTERLELTTRA
ncbi:MAG: asparagine synthase (glutamine-hydrolyzing) [Gemmatimonadaceae bacterium]